MGSLTDLLGRTPRVAVVEALAEHPELEFSVPEIVHQTGISKRGVYIHIAKLLEEGLIRRGGKLGKCQYYRINENDRRGELLELLESVFTLGKVEREVKRDRGILPAEPLEPRVGPLEAIITPASGEAGIFLGLKDLFSPRLSPETWTIRAALNASIAADANKERESHFSTGTTATGIAASVTGAFGGAYSRAAYKKLLTAVQQG